MVNQQKWRISCEDTAEALSRLVSPLRRRGMRPTEVHFSIQADGQARCELEFQCTDKECHIIQSNWKSISCITAIEQLNKNT